MPYMAITKEAEVEEVEAGAEEAEAVEEAVNTEEAIVVAEAADVVAFAEGEEEETIMAMTMQLHGVLRIETIMLMNGSPYHTTNVIGFVIYDLLCTTITMMEIATLTQHLATKTVTQAPLSRMQSMFLLAHQ